MVCQTTGPALPRQTALAERICVAYVRSSETPRSAQEDRDEGAGNFAWVEISAVKAVVEVLALWEIKLEKVPVKFPYEQRRTAPGFVLGASEPKKGSKSGKSPVQEEVRPAPEALELIEQKYLSIEGFEELTLPQAWAEV